MKLRKIYAVNIIPFMNFRFHRSGGFLSVLESSFYRMKRTKSLVMKRTDIAVLLWKISYFLMI